MNGYAHHVDSLDENCWTDLIDCSTFLDDAIPPTGLYWNTHPPVENDCVATDVSFNGTTSQVSDCIEERDCRRKRFGNENVFSGQQFITISQMELARSLVFDVCHSTGDAVINVVEQEIKRREKLNDRFAELSATLEPGRPVKTDKLAILGDAIRVLNQLKTESQEYKEMNIKLSEEIKNLKDEKNERREEKLVLKTDKERMEQQLKTMAVPPTGFMQADPPVYPAAPNKMPMFPSYSLVPVWQYLPSSVRDTSQDHELRPPAA